MALLPTELYIAGGLAAVILTVAVIAILPADGTRALFSPRHLRTNLRMPTERARGLVAALAFAAFVGLLYVGWYGSNDPTRNPLTVAIWTFLWLHLLLFAGLVGNPWPWVNPWTFPLAIFRRAGVPPRTPLDPRIGHWPALASLGAIAALLLVHPEAADPDTLVRLALIYWAVHLTGAVIFGGAWLHRAEAFTVIFAAFASLAPLARRAIGTPGWQALAAPRPDTGLALFMIGLLAMGSFDGLYKTYFWLGIIGVNPLEFAGRTTVTIPNGIGLAAALPVLAALYAACLALGLASIGAMNRTGVAFRAFAPTLLPIAFAYHLAHFLPALLVETQFVPLVLNDPLGTGAALLGMEEPRVTTGFLNRLDTVRIIWLVQAGAVVLGHMLAIAMAHRVALDIAGSHRRAAISQLPLAAFMVAYTLFGLWLLASPQGA